MIIDFLERKKLALYELGIMKSGIQVFKKIFYTIERIRKYSDDAKGQMLDGISSLSKVSLNENINKMKLKDYNIVFVNREVKVDKSPLPITYRIYCIGDKKLNTNFSERLLNRVLTLYLEKYELTPGSNIIAKIPNNSEFEKEVEKIIGDFYATSFDRMMNLFF